MVHQHQEKCSLPLFWKLTILYVYSPAYATRRRFLTSKLTLVRGLNVGPDDSHRKKNRSYLPVTWSRPQSFIITDNAAIPSSESRARGVDDGLISVPLPPGLRMELSRTTTDTSVRQYSRGFWGRDSGIPNSMTSPVHC